MQKDEGFSLADQEHKLRSYCDKHGIEVLIHYQDDHSAKNFDRPEFQKFLLDLKEKRTKPTLFLCVRIDRFSRNMMAGIEMINYLKQRNVEVRFVENNYELDSPESLIPFVLNMLLPQVENERRGLNTKAGMRQGLKEGRWLWKAPIGYLNHKETKTIIIDPIKAPLIKEAFTLISKGIYSVDEVRKMLRPKGITCCKQNFLNTVRNPFYVGKLTVPKSKDEPEVVIKALHEPLITEELFNEVQNVINGRRKNFPSKITRNDNLPMRGYLICNSCGGQLTGSGSRSRSGAIHFYYHCQKNCKNRFRADKANEEFEKHLSSFEIPKEVLKLYFEVLQDIFKQDDQMTTAKIRDLANQIVKVEERISSLEDKFIDNAISEESYCSIKKRYEKEVNELIGEHSSLTHDKSSFYKYFDFGLSFLWNMDKYYREARLEIKQKIIGSIFPEKIIYEHNGYRTTRKNELLTLLTTNINDSGGLKKVKADISVGLSTLAPSAGLEPATL